MISVLLFIDIWLVASAVSSEIHEPERKRFFFLGTLIPGAIGAAGNGLLAVICTSCNHTAHIVYTACFMGGTLVAMAVIALHALKHIVYRDGFSCGKFPDKEPRLKAWWAVVFMLILSGVCAIIFAGMRSSPVNAATCAGREQSNIQAARASFEWFTIFFLESSLFAASFAIKTNSGHSAGSTGPSVAPSPRNMEQVEVRVRPLELSSP